MARNRQKKQLAALSVLGVAALLALSMHFFAWRDAVAITAAMLVACAVPLAVYSGFKHRTVRGGCLLLIVAAAYAGLAIVNIYGFTYGAGGTLQEPVLLSDDGRYYAWARHYYDGSCPKPSVAFKGLPLMALASWRLLGLSIAWPIAMNLMWLLLAIALTGMTAARALTGRIGWSGSRIAFVAMLATSLLTYFTLQALCLLKEAMVYFAVAAIGYVLVGMARQQVTEAQRKRGIDAGVFLLGTAVLALARTTYVYFEAIGIALAVACNWRVLWRRGAAMLAMTAVAFALANMIAGYSYGVHWSIIEGGDKMQSQYIVGVSQQPYLDMVGQYFSYPVWRRLLLLPLSMAVQFVVPFPWLYAQPSGVLELMPRTNWMWYAVGALAMFYYLFMSRNRGTRLSALAWWPVMAFAIVSYITAGSVNRYFLPFEPMLVIVAIYAWVKSAETGQRRKLLAWLLAFAVALAVTLVACYNVQVGYLERMNN